MQQRGWQRPPSKLPGQQMSFTVRGKTYAVCSEGQMAFMRQQATERVIAEANDKGEPVQTEEDLKKRLDEWQENCGFATLASVMAKLTPQEQAEWAAKYRFSGVNVTHSR